ncbi:unnamed protein product [Owenia fusiformis]|uniref:Uncharacterized protein n=1 Tax=Owenia fusiformis TaxID=6347 RepID=A0A8S4NT37_OWEFU|nr:unnamed protein product [Owenia fusiformis]
MFTVIAFINLELLYVEWMKNVFIYYKNCSIFCICTTTNFFDIGNRESNISRITQEVMLTVVLNWKKKRDVKHRYKLDGSYKSGSSLIGQSVRHTSSGTFEIP